MIERDLYVSEKLAEFRRDTATSRAARAATPRLRPADPPKTRPLVGPLARAAGRRVRRVGEAIEQWSTPHPAS